MPSSFGDGVLWYAAFVFSTTCHEAAHAWAALRLGDDTASRGGQVSLSPIPHVKREPVGMVVIPILTWLMGGWMMGWASAPYDPTWARRYPRRAAWMALAGPAANLGLMLLAALLIRVGVEWHVLDAPYVLRMGNVTEAVGTGAWTVTAHAFSVMFSLNLLLCLFNLLPVPPLDGSSALLLLLPESGAQGYMDAVRSPFLRLVGLMLIFRGLDGFFGPVLAGAAGLLYPGVSFR